MEPNFAEKELTVGSRVIIETLYNGISVFVDKETGYYYAGKICFDCKKRFENLAQNQDYELMKQAISATTGIPVVELECIFEGMGNGYRSKWIHPLLVHSVCEWANKRYAVQVSMLMNEKAKQALIEKKTLQEQIDKERIHTERLEDELNGVTKQRDDVIAELRAFRAEANAKFDAQTQALNDANAKLDAQTQELAQAHAQRNEIQATLNQERDANTEFRNNVNQAIVDIKHQVDERFTQASDFIDNKLSGLNLTTATTAWLFIVIKRPSLVQKLRDKHIITQHQSVYDTICCKLADRAKELRRHEYNDAEDEIVLERPCSNSLDLSHFIRRRFDPTIARCLNISGECYRKIVYTIGAEENILAQLTHHLATALNVKQEIAQSLDGTQLATREYIDERFHQLEAQQAQQMQAINDIAEEVHQIHEIVQTIAEMLDQVHPNANSIFHRCRYRELHREADGRVWCEDTKGGPRYYITEDDIARCRFR